ncbi:MAG: hypothetical protein QNJ69_13025 [Gammaproteobacteria bacterium]|nr:hypothetical protein [Gammaproteobacteria bacterium]
MKIHRHTATEIMSKAVASQEHCLLGVMDAEENLYYCDTREDMLELIEQYPQSIWFYNQHADAMESIEQIEHPPGQGSIEIFQDTEGVFGLRAYLQQDRMQTPVTLELTELAE